MILQNNIDYFNKFNIYFNYIKEIDKILNNSNFKCYTIQFIVGNFITYIMNF